MTEEMVNKFVESEEFQNILQKYLLIASDDYFRKPKESLRFLTETEKKLIFKALIDKNFEIIRELYKLGCDINTCLFPLENQLLTVFTIGSSILTDDDTCKLIDVLEKCEYDFNMRTVYNGGNYVLSLALSFKPKSAKKLIELGVSCNVTNRTLNRLYKTVKDIADYTLKEDLDQILESSGMLDDKDKIINEYKSLLIFLDKKGINDDFNDDYYIDIDNYIKKIKDRYSLDDSEENSLKELLYESLPTFISNYLFDLATKQSN